MKDQEEINQIVHYLRRSPKDSLKRDAADLIEQLQLELNQLKAQKSSFNTYQTNGINHTPPSFMGFGNTTYGIGANGGGTKT